MRQSKKDSLKESTVNIAVGYVVALISQLTVFPFFGINIPLSDNLWIGAWFTLISIIRSYIIRRWFNNKV